jgi:hypothetical protein
MRRLHERKHIPASSIFLSREPQWRYLALAELKGIALPRVTSIALLLLSLCAVARAADREELPQRTADPASRKWDLTTYLKGTAAEVKKTLDKDVVELDSKCKSAEADLKNSEKRYKEEEASLLGEIHKRPDYVEAADRLAKAQAELDAAKTGPLDQRMAASSQLNKVKQDVQRIEHVATTNPILVSIRKEQVGLKESLSRLQVARAKALDWRKQLTDAIVNTYSLYGPIRPGRSIGVLGTVKVVEVKPDGTVFAMFKLLEPIGADKAGEGLYDVRYGESLVPMFVRGAPDVSSMKPGQDATLTQTYRVTKIEPIKGLGDALVVEPYPIDIDYLLKTVLPLPIDPPPTLPRAATTQPTSPAKAKPKSNSKP